MAYRILNLKTKTGKTTDLLEVKQMSLSEKIVGTVYFHMIWVPYNMKNMHQIMKRFADYVYDIKVAIAVSAKLDSH